MADSMGLIQMNLHMIRSTNADVLIDIGVIGAVLVLIYAIGDIVAFNPKSKWLKHMFIEVGLLILFAVLLISGLRMPMRRQIQACAVGAVSIEAVAARYEVVKVDGKCLTLIEK